MKIAVVGVGGAGGYFGAHLARNGHDVAFVARGTHLDAIRASGLRVTTPTDDFVVHPAHAEFDPGRVGVVDLVLVGVKAWQLRDAARMALPLLDKQTVVVPLQNGVEAADQLGDVVGTGAVLGGMCLTISWLDGPGQIRTISNRNVIRFGEADGGTTARVDRLRADLSVPGVEVETPADIMAAVWEKFLFVVPFGGVGAVARAPAGVTRALPGTRRMLLEAMSEIFAVARARGIMVHIDAVSRAMSQFDALPYDATASLQRDITAGRPSELDAWSGAVVRLGREAGVPTPTNEFICDALVPGERRARGELVFSGEGALPSKETT